MALLDYIKKFPVSYTYFGIGSCPHSWGNELTPKYDQLLPVFFQEEIQRQNHESFRVIHFDPAFDRYTDELTDYFTQRGFVKEKVGLSDSFQHWKSSIYPIEILLFAKRFNHPAPHYPETDEWILEEFCAHIVQDDSLEQFLVLQEFTGDEITNWFKQLYAASPNPSLFRKQILFDVSYGLATGCSTDMSKYRPFRDEKGYFYNLLLIPIPHLAMLIGKNPVMDSILQIMLIQNYKMTLNSYHVDYRRRLRGESVLFQNTDYTGGTDPDFIMKVLLEKLSLLVKLLLRLTYITEQNSAEFQKLASSYCEYDVYKWYSLMDKLVPVYPYAQ